MGDEDAWRSERDGGSPAIPRVGGNTYGSLVCSGSGNLASEPDDDGVMHFNYSFADEYEAHDASESDAVGAGAAPTPTLSPGTPHDEVGPRRVPARSTQDDDADGPVPLRASAHVPVVAAIGSPMCRSSVRKSRSTSRLSRASLGDDDGTVVDLSNPSASLAAGDVSVSSDNTVSGASVLDDFAWELRAQCADDRITDAWLAAREAGGGLPAKPQRGSSSNSSGGKEHVDWRAVLERYQLPSGAYDDARIKADAQASDSAGSSPYELARLPQSAEDLENVAAVVYETPDAVYDAEVLREREVRRERAAQRVRAQQQLAWYRETYGESTGKEMFEAAREQRLKATKVRMTLSEMRKRVFAAEYALKSVGSEFIGYVITSITVVMFMIHPNITKQFFMVLSCKSVGGTADPGASFLLGDLTEPCYSRQHVFFICVLGIPMFLFWVFGIPFFAWVILYRNKHLIQAPVIGTSATVRAQKKNFESQMAFLYRGYKPSRYYWFLLDMGRKVALVAISVFFPGALHTQLLLASLLIFVCIICHIVAQPFENRIPGVIESFSLGTSFMIFFLANFLFVDTVSEDAKMVATVFIVVLVCFFFATVVAGLIVLVREERALAPLRVLLREAYVLGHDVALVIRKWRIDQTRRPKKKKADQKVSAADTAHKALDAVVDRAAHGRHQQQVRGHDEVLTIAASTESDWGRSLAVMNEEIRDKSDVLKEMAANHAAAHDAVVADAAIAVQARSGPDFAQIDLLGVDKHPLARAIDVETS
jgi:hypothetical protein